jgi:hypothetical protein
VLQQGAVTEGLGHEDVEDAWEERDGIREAHDIFDDAVGEEGVDAFELVEEFGRVVFGKEEMVDCRCDPVVALALNQEDRINEGSTLSATTLPPSYARVADPQSYCNA